MRNNLLYAIGAARYYYTCEYMERSSQLMCTSADVVT